MGDQMLRGRYLAAMAERHGAVVLPIGVRFALNAVFQPLHLRRDPVTAEDLPHTVRRTLADEAHRRTEEENTLPLLEETGPVIAENGPAALAQSPTRRLVILGGPGTGKTTLLKDLLARAIHAATTDIDAPLPIFIALPDVARTGLDVRTYLENQARDLGVGDFVETLWEMLTTGRAFLCLDSLDEVAPALRPDIITLINRMTPRWGGTWVIGSRFTEYKGGQFGHEHFAEWQLAPLDAPLRQELARRIFAAMGVERASTDFVAALLAHPHAQAWGENPLLLSLAAVVYARAGALPSSRAALYGLVLDAVLATRTPELVRRTALAKLLADVALRLHQTRGRTFTRTDLRAIIGDVRPEIIVTAAREAAIDTIIGCGLLEVVAHETYGFQHQTFGEYLAAAALADDLAGDDGAQATAAWDLAWSKRQYSRWTEVLSLMVGILPHTSTTAGTEAAARWLRALVAQQTSAEGDPGNLGLLLALHSVGEITAGGMEWHAGTTMDVETEIVAAWIAMMLRKFHHATYVFLQSLAPAKNKPDASVQRIDPRAMATGAQTLIAIARDQDSFERIAALNVLATLGRHAPVDDLRALLITEYSADDNIHSNRQNQVIESVMFVLGEAGVAEPHEIFVRALDDDSLKQCVQRAIGKAITAGDVWWSNWSVEGMQSTDPAQRRRVLHVVGQAGIAAPIEQMVAIALNDADMDVRVAALKSLAQLGEHAPISVLLAALHDPHPTIFTAAENALSTLNHPAVIQELAPALLDTDPKIRTTIAQLLRWKAGVPVAYITSAWALTDDIEMKTDLLRLMGTCGAQAPIDLILASLHDANAEVAAAAMRALAAVSEYAPHESVLAVLAEGHRRETVSLISSLGRWGSRAPVDLLMTASTHENSAIRSAACEALGRVGRRDALPTLIARLSDDEWAVRCEAAEAVTRLGEPGDELTPAAMLTAFRRCDQGTRAHALRILDALGPDAPMDMLLAALRDHQEEVRAEAVDVLVKRGVLTSDQMTAALDDPSRLVIHSALTALRLHPDPAFLDRVSAFVTGADMSLIYPALHTLEAYGEAMPIAVVLGALQSDDRNVRGSAIRTLNALGADAPADVFMALAVGEHRSLTYDTLAKVGARIPLEWYLEQLRTHPAELNIMRAMLTYGEHIMPEQLAQMRTARESIVRDVALVIAAYQGIGPIDQALWDRWEELPKMLRTSVFTVFGSRLIDFPQAIIFDNLLTMDRTSRETLIAAWSADPTRVPIATLREWLRDPAMRKRQMALVILGKVGDPVDGASFVAALADPDTSVRSEAARVLCQRLDLIVPLDSFYAAMIPGETPLNMELAQAIAARGGIPPLAKMVEMLSDSDYNYDAAAFFTILGARAPIEPLLLALGDSDGDIVNTVLETITAIDRTLLRRVQPEAERIMRDYEAGDILGAQIATQITQSIRSMERIPAAFFTVLTTFLDAPYAPVALHAIYALQHIRRNIPDTTLRRLLALRLDAPTPTLRTAADGALAAILSLENGMEDEN